MPKPLLYQPPPRWHVWAALGGAALIHIGAVVAAIRHEPPPMDLTDMPSAEVIATLEAPAEEPTPPPEDIPLPEPPPMPEVQPEFQEETTPPPKRPPSAKIAPVKAPTVARPSGMQSISTAKALAINSPRPEYPYEARSRKIMGSGVCVVSVDASGNVTDATMVQSIGSPILDNSAVNAFRRWRFRPGVAPKVKIPITFTMTGASY
jgi:periplasmic protein TonB